MIPCNHTLLQTVRSTLVEHSRIKHTAYPALVSADASQ